MSSPRNGPLVIAVVDAGPLYAAVDAADDDHARCLDIVIPALVVAEVTHIIAARLGAKVEAGFLAGLEQFEVEAPAPEDWARISKLVQKYANFPLGGTDASVAALADRLGTGLVVTLDHRHFAAIRPAHTAALHLLPD